MANAYRERISDERLKAVSEHMRTWLFPPRNKKKSQRNTSEGGIASPKQ